MLGSPCGVCVDPGPDGKLFVAEWLKHAITVLTKEGNLVRTIEGLSCPSKVAVEPGPNGRLYVSDTSNARVQVFFKKDGAHAKTISGTGSWDPMKGSRLLSKPHGVAVEPGPDGCILFADMSLHRVLVFLKG